MIKPVINFRIENSTLRSACLLVEIPHSTHVTADVKNLTILNPKCEALFCPFEASLLRNAHFQDVNISNGVHPRETYFLVVSQSVTIRGAFT